MLVFYSCHSSVGTDDAEMLSDRNSMLFVETSAKTAANVSAIFDTVAMKLAGNGAASQLPTAPVLASS